MFNPPITGIQDLDAFLSQLVIEGTGGGTTNALTSDVGTGIINDSTGALIGYLYKYIHIKYADNNTGGGISDSPTNKSYYGVRNSTSATESTNPAGYTWYLATGGFGTTKFLWYQSTGGKQINFAVSAYQPDDGWVADAGGAIDLDVVTSGNIPTVVDSFVSFFSPNSFLIPRDSAGVPVFTDIKPALYASNKSVGIVFVDAQTDSDTSFANDTWRIGASDVSGNEDISYTNITIGDPIAVDGHAEWPEPTTMPTSPGFITVPIRYKNPLGAVSQASVATIQLVFAEQGPAGPTIDISGYTAFVQNAGGAFNPPLATLHAITTNVVSPVYTWEITNATPTTGNFANISITPDSSATQVLVSLTVDGSNLYEPVVKEIILPVVYDGAAGEAGANGTMSAFPTIYRWTTSSTAPIKPSALSTYTWSTGDFTPPVNWTSSVTSNTTPGSYLWSITHPLNVSATTLTSELNWFSKTVKAVSYNGTAGNSGAATFVVVRAASGTTGEAPTNVEVNAVIGRNPVAGDIVTVSFNNYNGANVYKYVTSWVLFTTYITGSLIVQNTITGDKIAANTITADRLSVSNLAAINANLGTVTAGSLTGTSLVIGNPVRTGTTISSGAGATLETDGTFALGNTTGNVAFDGTNVVINGPLVATPNIITNAVTNLQSYLSKTRVPLPYGDDFPRTLLISLPITATGRPVNINGLIVVERSINPYSFYGLTVWRNTNYSGMWNHTVIIGTSVLATYEFPIVLNDVPPAGEHIYYVELSNSTGPDPVDRNTTVTLRSLSVNEIKR